MRDQPTHYFGEKGKQLSGVEYDRAIREMDAAFQGALADAWARGDFPPEAYRKAAA